MENNLSPVHIRVSLWRQITGLLQEHLKAHRLALVEKEADPRKYNSMAHKEILGAIKGLRSVLHSLRAEIDDDLKQELEELEP